MNELFLNQEYGRLFEKAYRGECQTFEFKSPLGVVKHLFIKREVPYQIDDKTYYDLVTPFTYGGPVILTNKEEDKWELLNDFQNAFQDYCLENNIVSEFIQFHPLSTNSLDFLYCYELDYVDDSRGRSMAVHDSTISEEFSGESQEMILHAFERGVAYEISQGTEKYADFVRFFSKVNGSSDDNSQLHLNGCEDIWNDQLILIEVTCVGEVIGMGLNIMVENDLSSLVFVTDEKGDSLGAAYVMQYGLTVWSKNNGVKSIHLACDWVNKNEEEIAAFKEHFGEQTNLLYCIGRKVWNEEIYKELCERAQVERYIDYFPAYRVGEKGQRSLSRGGEINF